MVVTCFSSYYEKFADGKVVCIDEEVPFTLPGSWSWCRLVDVGITETGTTPSKTHPEYFGNYIPFLGPANILDDKIINVTQGLSEIGMEFGRAIPSGSILQVCIGGSIGKCAIASKKVTFNQQINSITPIECDIEYVHYVLQSETFRLSIMEKATGTATPIINRGNWEQLLFPLPPFQEQRRIVLKLLELKESLKRYSAAQTSLDNLNEAIRRKLHKSILQEAIQGKLVLQNASEEPATVLLQRIKEEKLRLVKEGKLKKKDVVDSVIYKGDDNKYFEKKGKETREITDEIPFDIPNSWQWCRVKQILDIGSARRVHQKDWRSTGIPFYRAREIGKLAEYGNVNNELFIDYELYKEFSTSGVPMPGDLMVTAVGTLGKVYVVKDGDLFYYKDGSVLCINNRYNLNPLYLKYVIGSPMFINQFVGESQGTTVATLTMVRFNDYLMPIPPLREQERIVKAIDNIASIMSR